MPKYRIKNFLNELENEMKPEIFWEDDFIELRKVGFGSSFKSTLCYNIKRDELCVIKKPLTDNLETPNLMDASIYSKILWNN